ncbi:MAG: zf-HC2 domain-containing protein [Candidatus Omnitrophota bacterium]
MFKCFFTKRKLVDYLDGTLSPLASEGIRRHLDVCVSCRAAFAGLENVGELARKAHTPSMNEESWVSFDRRLSDRLDEMAKPFAAEPKKAFAALFFPRWRPVLVAMPLAIIALAIGLRLVTPRLYERQTVAMLAELDLLDEVAKDNGRGVLGEDDVSAEIEMLYQLDPALLKGIS